MLSLNENMVQLLLPRFLTQQYITLLFTCICTHVAELLLLRTKKVFNMHNAT